jgi:hypothetical protein
VNWVVERDIENVVSRHLAVAFVPSVAIVRSSAEPGILTQEGVTAFDVVSGDKIPIGGCTPADPAGWGREWLTTHRPSDLVQVTTNRAITIGSTDEPLGPQFLTRVQESEAPSQARATTLPAVPGGRQSGLNADR